jgi:hypothetical protein
MFSFSGPHVRFLRQEILRIDSKIVGIFAVYNVIKKSGGDDLVPIYWGYGNVRKELLRLLSHSCVSLHMPQFCNYKDDVNGPDITLKRLKAEWPPACSS